MKQCKVCLRIFNGTEWVDADLPLQEHTEKTICRKCSKVVEFPLRYQGKTVKANKPYRKPIIL